MKTNINHWAGITVGILSLAACASATVIGSEKYTYDASGNIIEKSIDGKVTRFDYQNNTLKSNDQGIVYEQDAAGRLISELKDRQAARKFSYQYGDKVTSVVKGAKTTDYYYNADGQLVGTNASDKTEPLVWDGFGLVMRGEQIYVNETHFVGGVPTLVDGKVAVSDSLGSALSIGGSNFNKATAFGEGLESGFFTGKPYIRELNGYAFKHRYYGVEELKWQTPDPSGFPNGENAFMFSNGDPLTYLDPDGLEAFVQDFAFVTVSSPANNGNTPAPILMRLVGTSAFSRYNEIQDALGVCGYSTPAEGNSASFSYLPPSVIYNSIPVRHNEITGGVDWSRFKAPIKGYATAYVADANGIPVQGSSVNLEGVNSEFYTSWIQEN